jgi:hypothetical protein
MDRLHELRAAAVATAFRMEAEKAGMSDADIRYAIEGLTRPGALAYVETLYRRVHMFQQDLHHAESMIEELSGDDDASE